MMSDKPQTSGAGAGDSGDNFAAMFEQSMAAQEISEGEIVTGTIVKVDPDGVVVDIGYKSEGFASREEFERNGEVTVQEGDRVRVYVESLRVNPQGYCRVSKQKADRLRIWDEIAEAFEKEAIVEGKITGRVKGGLEVDIGVKAFLPASQADVRMPRNLDRYLNEVGQFRIIKFNRRRGNVVLSRRAVLEEQRGHMREETLKVLTEGAIVTGTVKNLTDYGAFIDLGGIDGLLHISDMSWARIKHPSEVIKSGDEIRVQVLQFDRDKERVSLGLKQLQNDPWATIDTDYPIGMRTKGTVTSIADYGAFVEIAGGVEGLIHVSEMSWTRKVRHPKKIVNTGDEVEVMILDVDRGNRRMSLGMKQVQPNPWDEIARTYPSGARLRGTVKSITDFGVFVGVDEEIDGLVHISDVSWTDKNPKLAEMFKEGDEVETVVLNVDTEGQRLSLGIKQLADDPWESYYKSHKRGDRVQCKVVSITDFGVFVELAEGIEGLIRTSELAAERVQNPRDVVDVGQEITAEITQLDTRDRKISLSIRMMQVTDDKADLKAFHKSQGSASSTFGDLLGEKLRNMNQSGAEEAAPAEDSETKSGEGGD